jgi:hypothetical protein
MPHFHLHLCNGEGLIEDEHGHEFSDLAQAREDAVKSLREVSADEVGRGIIYTASFVEIEDWRRRHIATVNFDDAVQVSTHVVRKPRALR